MCEALDHPSFEILSQCYVRLLFAERFSFLNLLLPLGQDITNPIFYYFCCLILQLECFQTVFFNLSFIDLYFCFLIGLRQLLCQNRLVLVLFVLTHFSVRICVWKKLMSNIRSSINYWGLLSYKYSIGQSWYTSQAATA